MQLNDFKEVHPNWTVLSSLDDDASRAVAELLLLGLLVDGEASEASSTVAAQAYARLPMGEAKSTAEIRELARDIISLDSSRTWQEVLMDIASRVEAEEERIAALRLLAIVLAVDVATEREQELCYAAGHLFDIDYDTVEDILRSAWETHEKQLSRERGVEHDVPPIFGARWARERGTGGWDHVFQQKQV